MKFDDGFHAKAQSKRKDAKLDTKGPQRKRSLRRLRNLAFLREIFIY